MFAKSMAGLSVMQRRKPGGWARARRWVGEGLALTGVSSTSPRSQEAHQWLWAILRRWGRPQFILPSPGQVLCLHTRKTEVREFKMSSFLTHLFSVKGLLCVWHYASHCR